MSDDAPAQPDASPPRGAEPLSPTRSALAVLAGVIAYWISLTLFVGISASFASSWFPHDEGSVPTQEGMATIVVGELINGIVAGLLTARLAGRAPLAHAATLASLLGIYALTSMDQVRGMPGWFAFGFAFGGPVAVALGGLLARRVMSARPAS